MPNPVGWFEIPVADMDRARTFYNTVFGYELPVSDMGDLKMAWFPSNMEEPGATGSLIYNEEHYTPSTAGTLVYLSCEDVAETIAKVEGAGGKVLQNKKKISDTAGYMGLFLDTEGNRVALHSWK